MKRLLLVILAFVVLAGGCGSDVADNAGLAVTSSTTPPTPDTASTDESTTTPDPDAKTTGDPVATSSTTPPTPDTANTDESTTTPDHDAETTGDPVATSSTTPPTPDTANTDESTTTPDPDAETTGDLVVTETGHPLMVDIDVAALVEDGGPIELTVSELGSTTTAPNSRTMSVLSEGGKVRLRGLRAETTYEVTTTGTARYRGEFTTGPLPDGLPPITTELLDPAATAPGHTLFNLLDLREELGDDDDLDPLRPAGWLLIADEAGEIVWYHNQDHSIGDARFLEDGTILFEYNDTGGRRINLDGDLLDEWAGSIITGRFLIDAQGRQVIGDTPIVVNTDAMHHEQHRLPDGTHVTLSAELRVLDGFDTPQCDEDPATFDGSYHLIGDVIVIFDPATGKVLNEFSIFDYFDPRDDPANYNLCGLFFDWVFPNWLYKGVDPLARDWTHANAVEVDEASNALIVSIRHLDALLALRWTDDAEGPAGEALWQSGRLGDLTLTNGSWHRYQHAPEVQDDGTILVYDNGNHRPGFGTSENPYFSRAVLYSIDGDAKTAEQLWEFRSSLNGQPAFAGFVGDADRLANGNVLITDGGLNGDIDGVTSAQIVEVVPFGSDGGDIVWRLTVEGGAGWVVYRSERLAGVFD